MQLDGRLLSGGASGQASCIKRMKVSPRRLKGCEPTCRAYQPPGRRAYL